MLIDFTGFIQCCTVALPKTALCLFSLSKGYFVGGGSDTIVYLQTSCNTVNSLISAILW